MLDKLEAVRSVAMAALKGLSNDDLRKPVKDEWQAAADPYVRTICLTNAHVRQIWLLRGAQGIVSAEAWPRQHWA